MLDASEDIPYNSMKVEPVVSNSTHEMDKGLM